MALAIRQGSCLIEEGNIVGDVVTDLLHHSEVWDASPSSPRQDSDSLQAEVALENFFDDHFVP